jgi:hypothetical protein
MAKKWSDVAASAAFQALSFEEQEEARRQYFEEIVAPRVPTEDVALARDQFLAETARKAGGGRGPINPPPAPATDYSDMATAMQGAPTGGPLIRSVMDQPGEVPRTPGFDPMLNQDYVASVRRDIIGKAAPEDRMGLLTTLAENRTDVLGRAARQILAEAQAENKRISLDQEGRAQRLLDAPRGPGNLPPPRPGARVAPPVSIPDVTPGFGDIMDGRSAKQIADRRMLAQGVRVADEGLRVDEISGVTSQMAEAEGRRKFAEENPLLGSIAAGSAGLISGVINIPSVAADAFNKTAINPVLRALGMQDLPPVSTAFGTEYLAKSASDFMPKVGKQEMDVAIKRDEFAPWLMSKLAANSPQIAQSLLAAFAPPLRAVLLPGMAGTAAGQSFAQGDDSRVALAKGAVEYVSEKLPLGVFDKVGDVLKGMSPAKANTVLAVAGQRALQAGGAITANGLTNAIEEVAAQFGGNVLDKYFQGKDIELTKGLAEAGVVGGVTGKLMSAPQVAAAATGYYEPGRQIAREIDSVGRAFENLGPEASRAISIDMLRTEAGTSNLISPAATVRNFTPPDSPTKQAGLVDIEVPLPNAASILPEINPSTEEQFGLDKLRMGGANVGTTGLPGGLAGAGGEAGGGLIDGSMGAAGPGDAGAPGLGGRTAPIPGVNDRQAVPPGGPAGQQPAGVAVGGEPLTWTGRAKTGYANEQDAQQAMATASTVIDTRQTHDWRVEPMGNGRFQIVGYQKETNLGTQTPQAQQGQTQGAAPAIQMAGAAQGGAGGIPAATGTPLELSDTERAGLKLAPTAPLRELSSLNKQLDQQLGVTFSPVKSTDLNDSQRLASAVARLMGKTLTVVHQETGAGALPNGMINTVGGKHLFVADDADDAPLAITVHEAYHGLPEAQRKSLNTALLDLFRQDRKGEFLNEFSYTPDKFEEEAPAMMVQAISKREDFWQELRTKMGNKEFGEVAKTIIAKLGDILTGAKKQYGEDFVNKYISDVEKARNLLTTAYADAMKAQGLQPDVQLEGMAMASERSRIGMDFKDVVKRTPELQAAAERVKAGEMTAAEYDKLVDEYKPVEPYTSVPQPAADADLRTALTSDKVDRIGVPSKTLKAGEPVGLRLDIPAYSNHGTWVVSVHQQESGYNAGKSIGYEPVAAATNVTFGVVEKAALNIAGGKPKATIAVIKGGWKPTTPAEAKLKADQALKSKDWVQVGMDPERHSYFYDRSSMEPVVSADEVIQIGPLVLAKNPTYGKKSEFMFSNRVVPKATEYQPKRDNYAAPKTAEFLPTELVERARGYVTQFKTQAAPVQISGADRLKAEELLRPRMQAAQEAKLDYDQKILDIGERTGALGQMLAPLKKIKRAAEKLAVEEKFNVDNIKDLLRSTIVVDSYADAPAVVDEIRKEFEVLRVKNRTDIEMAGDDVDNKGFLPSGYGDVLINVRMPNGTMAEIQVNVPEMLAAKGEEGHSLYEIERDQPEGSDIRKAIVEAQSEYYREAAAAAARRKYASSEGAPERGSASRSSSSPVASSSLNTRPSGNLTQSSPENEATNSQPAGKEEGTFIGSPDESSVSQALYASNKAKTAGSYTYTTDSKGRITVSGDVARIRFLTRKLANGIVNDQGVRFNAEDVAKVLKALKAEPKTDAAISSDIADKLSLSKEELASTSLEYQTGLPKDRAFVAPLQGGIPEAVRFLEDRRRASGLRLLDISKPQDQDTLSKLIAAETLAAIRSSGNALEWYDETIAKTLAMAAVKYPELASDVNAQMVFRLAMAITSQGLNVENNLKFTMRQYDAFRRTGSYPEIGEGDSSQAMIGNFKLANELMAEMGQDTFRRFLVTPFTIGELNSAGFDPGGERVDEMVLGSSVFGPKIGFGFYSNLNGNFEPVTMDMWFMRTIGRLTGSLRTFDAERFGSQLERFRKSFDERGSDGVFADRFDAALIERARTDQDAAIELARQVKKAHERDFKENRAAFDAKTRKKSSLVLAADTMVQSIDKPRDVPASGTERRQLREVVRKAVAEVERVYGQRIPPAAMQALIWYPEQELYKALGVKLSVTSQDYAGATEKVLKEEGYDDKRLRAAAESGARRARQKDGSNVAGGNQTAGTKARQTGPIQGTEREQFLRDRYERAELAKEQVAPRRKGVVFEVAPDPNNESLTAAWRSLDAGQRREISERVAREIVPRVLSQFETDGIIAAQVGSYLDDTNPSFTLLLDKGDVVEVAKALGFVLAQDSMMVISPKEFKGGDKVSALSIEVGNKSQAEIDGIYQKLREIRVGEDQPIAGQSYSNGVMTILNYSSVPSAELAILVDQKLNKAYSILTRDVFAAFPGKQEYDYASAANDGRGSRADLRRRARDLRSEATAALERELSDTGVQFSNRGGSDAAGGGRDRGVGPQDVQAVTPSYGTPRDGAASAVAYHYSTQPRTTLDSVMYGTGLRGAEMARLQGADPRLKQRIYFYIDRGTGINPEAGVGGQAHRVNLQNLYDVDEDPLRLRRDNEAFNDFESAVIDAGFDGYMVRDAGPSGNAVLLGRHAVPVEQLGARGRMTGEPVAPARERVLSDAEKISANKMLPAGQVSGKRWAELISRSMPEVYERLAGNSVWQSDKVMYRGELARELRAQPMFSNRQLPKVSPQSALDADIKVASESLQRYIRAAEQGRQLPKLTIGRLPHVLNMLGARTQDFDIATSIVNKVFIRTKAEKGHADELPDITPKQLIEGIYRPAMVLKSKDGNPREFELVLPITSEQGALIVPIKVSVDKTDPTGAVMSIYAKGVSISGGKTNEQVLMKRINDGNLLYVDPGLAKQALTGRKSGDAKLNGSFVSWPGVWPKLEKMIVDRTVKTDINLMGWIGKYYTPSSSPQGWEDAPAFSQRARAENKEVAGLFRELQDARGLSRVRALERVDAHPMAETIRRIDQEFMDILERLDDAGLVKINCK